MLGPAGAPEDFGKRSEIAAQGENSRKKHVGCCSMRGYWTPDATIRAGRICIKIPERPLCHHAMLMAHCESWIPTFRPEPRTLPGLQIAKVFASLEIVKECRLGAIGSARRCGFILEFISNSLVRPKHFW